MSEDTKAAQSDQARDKASRRGQDEGDQRAQSSHDQPAEPRAAQADAEAAASAGEHTEEPPDPEAERSEAHADGDVDADGDEESLAAQLEAAQAELADQKDRHMRVIAEAENIRRRAETDVANARKYAIEGFASEILAVRDSLEIARALEISEDDAGAVAKMKEGLDLTLKQLDSALAKFSVEVVDPQKGDKLDPERHQAMTTQESDNVPPNHIVNVLQKGYTIHDRLLRPAMVVVAKKPGGESQAQGETA